MNNILCSFFSKSRRIMVQLALVCTVASPVAVCSVYAAETAVAATHVPANLKVGDNYGGGKVAYLFQSGDEGYVAGQTHGLISAKEDQASNTTWDKAVKACQQFKGGGFSDWRLPNKAELNRLYVSRAAIGGFKDHHFYWSSTESDKNDAWDQSFRTGVQNLGYKLDNNYVRAVRTF
ncbi:MAG TPA: DUF1566 domain-containing protein [Chlorobaculum sp.]|nr:DUF1566 domain-containing protein [Chlorobaculum sp.]